MRSRLTWVALAAVGAIGLLALSVDDLMAYAPGARRVYLHLVPFFGGRLTSFETFALVVRKAYSVVAFSALGVVAARAYPWGRTRILACAGGVGALSAGIEVLQKFSGSSESLRWNAFDVLCGVAGGVLGAGIAAAWRRIRRPADT